MAGPTGSACLGAAGPGGSAVLWAGEDFGAGEGLGEGLVGAGEYLLGAGEALFVDDLARTGAGLGGRLWIFMSLVIPSCVNFNFTIFALFLGRSSELGT